MNKTKNTSQINVQKMKQLLKDISTKNEELLQENADINTKLTSLVKLLKHKDDIINKIRLSLLFTIFKRKYNTINYVLTKKFYKLQLISKTNISTIKRNSNRNNNHISKTKKTQHIQQSFIITHQSNFNIKANIDKKEIQYNNNKMKIYKNNINIIPTPKKQKDKYSINKNTIFTIKGNNITNIKQTNNANLKKSNSIKLSYIKEPPIRYKNIITSKLNEINIIQITKKPKPKFQIKHISQVEYILTKPPIQTTSTATSTSNFQPFKNHILPLFLITSILKYHFIIKPKYYFINHLLLKYQHVIISTPIHFLKTLFISSTLSNIFKQKSFLNKSNSFYIIKAKFLLTTISSLQQSNLLYTSKISEFQQTFNEYNNSLKTKTEQNEKQLKQTISKIQEELKDKTIKYETLIQKSNETSNELNIINTQNNLNKKEIKTLNEQITLLNNNNSKLENQLQLKDNQILKLKKQITKVNENNNRLNNELSLIKNTLNEYENQIETLNTQITKLNRENAKEKISNEDLVKCNDELTLIIRNNKKYEIENANLKAQNEQFKIDSENVMKKYLLLKKEYDLLKEVSEESKNDLQKALEEMEKYSEILQELELKIEEAENEKKNAENERDGAFLEVKNIRKRYIGILGEKKNI